MPRSQLNATQDRSSQRTSQSISQVLPEDDMNRAISNTVRYMLCIFHTSKNLVKKQDIVKYCFPGSGRHFNNIMEAVKKYIDKVYSYKLIEVDMGAKTSNTKQYFVVRKNKLPETLCKSMSVSEEHKNYIILLLLTLAHIAGTGEICHEDTLWNLFTLLKILRKEESHPRFGDVKKRVLIEFTKHLYIETIPVNEEKVRLKWGQRALEEYNPEDMSNFIKQVDESETLDIDDDDIDGEVSGDNSEPMEE